MPLAFWEGIVVMERGGDEKIAIEIVG